jgi:2-dehydropantoate 2-reductase
MKNPHEGARIGIIGAGAMGCLHAVYFMKAGLDTVIYEKDPSVADALRAGIRVNSNPPETVQVAAGCDPKLLADCTIVFLFVKSYATEDALRDTAAHLAKNAILVSLQNGLGNYEKIRERVPAERIVFGTTSMGASKKDAGTLVPGGAGAIVIGGRNTAAVRTVFGLLVHCDLNVVITDDPDSAVWIKAIVNAGINPLAAILGVPNGRLIENPETMKIQELVVAEAVKASSAAGITVEEREMLHLTQDVCKKTASNICSMLQDLRAGRKTEIDSITGEILRTARTHNIPMPLNESLYLLVRALETENR